MKAKAEEVKQNMLSTAETILNWASVITGPDGAQSSPELDQLAVVFSEIAEVENMLTEQLEVVEEMKSDRENLMNEFNDLCQLFFHASGGV